MKPMILTSLFLQRPLLTVAARRAAISAESRFRTATVRSRRRTDTQPFLALGLEASLLVILSLSLAGCGEKMKAGLRIEEDPPQPKVEHELDASLVKVNHPERFPVVTASPHAAVPEDRKSTRLNSSH